jgi:hypothetical protein
VSRRWSGLTVGGALPRVARTGACLAALLIASTRLVSGQAPAQPAPSAPPPAASGAADVAQQLTNPIANLVSFPFQFNWEQGVGPNEDLRFVLNVQPVVPFTLNEKWNLVGRMIVPFIGQPALVAGGLPTSGTGDIVMSAFLSPSAPKHVIWGVGPVFGLPTNTDPFLGSGKWSMGPTAVVLKLAGPITYGALVNHLWSVASTGNYDRTDVNKTYLQPFVNYTTKNAVTLGITGEATADWEADGDTWTVPVMFSISKVTRLGPFPFSLGGGIGVLAAKPDGAPDWKLRLNATLILPRSR